uniref:Novel STAND NTPase 1 domain-containing protein n=1 Tax=Candidatus Methanophagaceae archaeon ANME-1 ERB6 TaxID=2759912 RepID=A0A7G9YX50_9EURY|nr:hypothetical protein NBNHMHLL_00016 [Methanosarcinales archaeon ANME-1 ERB6]
MKSKISVDSKVYDDLGGVEEIIATHLDEKLFEGLTEEDKYVAENILDALTGGRGLRAFLTIDEISKQIGRNEEKVRAILEHLIKKRIVHPPGKEDKIKGYELIHDFLSRRFFERLSPEARKIKTVIDIFRRAFRDWKQDGVLVSEDRLEMFYDIKDKLSWGDEECEFVLRSSFITYWYSENEWVKYFNSEIVIRICLNIIKGEENAKVMKGAIQTLGDTKEKRVVKPLIKIIDGDKRDDVRETAIDQFWFKLMDARIIDTLLKILKNERNYKLRKSAVSALSKYEEKRVVNALVESLHDSRVNVRAEAAYALGNIHDKSAIEHLIGALENEYSKRPRKNIIVALGKFLDDERVRPLLKSVVENDKEEYEVRQEAKWVLGRFSRLG